MCLLLNATNYHNTWTATRKKIQTSTVSWTRYERKNDCYDAEGYSLWLVEV